MLKQTPFWKVKSAPSCWIMWQPASKGAPDSLLLDSRPCVFPAHTELGLTCVTNRILQKYPRTRSQKTLGLLSCCLGSLTLGEANCRVLTLLCSTMERSMGKEIASARCASHHGTGFSSSNQAFSWLGSQATSCETLDQNSRGKLPPNSWPNSLS